MLKNLSKLLPIVGISVFMLSAAAQASVIYSYVGPNYTNFTNSTPPAGTFDNTMNVSGSFTLASALGNNLANQNISGLIQAFSFDNGRGTITDANGTIATFLISTGATGDISGWQINVSSNWNPDSTSLGAQRLNAQTCSGCAGGGGPRDIGQLSEVTQVSPRLVSSDSAMVLAGARVWTASSDVPEPGALMILGLGLAGLGFLRRRSARV